MAVGPEPRTFLSTRRAWTLLLLVWFAVHFAALFAPPLLDDADAAHANAAQHMALSGDWVTLQINGIRYLEKAPLPYWLNAITDHIFGYNVFSAHLPVSLGVLATMWLAWYWGRRAYGDRAAFYAALALETTFGVFLFTRITIPEATLTFLIGLALYCFMAGLEDDRPALFYVSWASLALATLTKGLIAPVFFLAAAAPWLLLTGEWRRWRQMRLFTGLLFYLAIAAPWHILAGLRNPDQGNPIGNVPTPGHVHGFFYFYFINEHVLRFLGQRYPHDYNKQPGWIYWVGQLAWLFPWSLFVPAVMERAWRTRPTWLKDLHHKDAGIRFRSRTTWMLALYAGFILLFFSLSTNQEYYTFPAYLPLLMLTGSVLASCELRLQQGAPEPVEKPAPHAAWLTAAHALFAVVGVLASLALGVGLWQSRHLPFVADIGTLLAHRGVGDYSLSMSHLFDLTGPSFAALRLPAAIAAVVLLLGPLEALRLRRGGRHFEATVSVAFTAAIFLVAAHIAFVRFSPMLSSQPMAQTINSIAGYPGSDPAAAARATLILYGDQSDGSSVLFYTRRQALLVHGRSSTLLWGSMWPDAPHIFLEDAQLSAIWGQGERKFLFAQDTWRDRAAAVLGKRLIPVQELADKTLYTDRPLP